jgi:hypothetical protein
MCAHATLHSHPKATEDEVEAITVVVWAIVGELTAELAVIIGELAGRVGRSKRGSNPCPRLWSRGGVMTGVTCFDGYAQYRSFARRAPGI